MTPPCPPTGAMMRRKKSVSNRDFFHNAHLPCFILCHLLEGFLSSVKGPFRGFHFSSEGFFFFLIFPVSTFQGGEAFLHHSFRAICIMAAFHLLQVSSGWRLQLPLTLYSCLLCFFNQHSKPLCSVSFLEKVFLHLTYILFFHGTPFFLHNLSALHICQWSLFLLPSENC